jgi:hypothetical protein
MTEHVPVHEIKTPKQLANFIRIQHQGIWSWPEGVEPDEAVKLALIIQKAESLGLVRYWRDSGWGTLEGLEVVTQRPKVLQFFSSIFDPLRRRTASASRSPDISNNANT